MKRWLVPSLLIVFSIAFRLLGSAFSDVFPNFQPLSALFFCSGALLTFGRFRNFGLATLAWLITYPATLWFHAPNSQGTADPGILITTFAGFLLSFIIGGAVQQKRSWVVLGSSVLAAITFHVATCGAAWLGDLRYAKTAVGLWQSLWAGTPTDKIPSWLFLQNMTLANVLFTGLLLAALRLPVLRTEKVRALLAR